MAGTRKVESGTCSICGGQTKTLYLDREELKICDDCGYGRPSLRDPMYYDESYEIKYLNYPEEAINKIRWEFVYFAAKGIPYKILDFGCGSGSFVRYAREKGHIAYGYDVNNFTDEIRPPDNFDPTIITLWDSFEHLTDEQQKEFFRKYSEAKIIIISVPDFLTPTKDATIQEWRHYRPTEHLHYYTDLALCNRFHNEGFSPLFISHSEDAVRKAPWEHNILTMAFRRDAK